MATPISLTKAALVALAAALAVAVVGAGGAPQQNVNAPFTNPDLAPEVRAHDLVSRMTLDQKVRQMQNNAPAIPELGVPAYNWWNEALHGVARAGQATVFPQAIGLAATWDTDLMFRVADAISTEARAKYHDAIRRDSHAQYYGLTFWSPNINIFRDPRWGRGQETYGEDPLLTGRLAVAFIKGLQGSDPKYFKVVATAKHFAVHSGPESTRHTVDVVPDARDVSDTYLPAFRMAMTEGPAYSIMCAYNRVNGDPACASDDLLQKTLRGDWGFTGFVVSDCGAIADIYRGHRVVSTAAEASAAAVKAGTDLTCGNEYVSLVTAVADSLITEAEIDRSLERLFVARFRLGMFDPDDRVPYARIPYSVTDSAEHRALALEAARRSIVLLKNDAGTLPLASSVRSIAVIGPSADDPVALLGNYNGFSSRTVTPLEGLEAQFGGAAEIRFAQGAPYVPDAASLIPAQAFAVPGGRDRGALAEYFANADLTGTAKLRRVEARPLVPNVRDSAVTAAGIPDQGYSARWTMTLTPPVSGEYKLSASGSAAGTRMFLDDVELVPPALANPPPAGRGRGRGQVQPVRTVLEAGRAYRFRVEYRPTTGRGGNLSNGPMSIEWVPPADALFAYALDVVRRSEMTVAFVGLNPRLEGEQMTVNIPGFSGGDRTDLALPAPQARLVDAALTTGRPVIVVLTSGSAVAITSAAEQARAVLLAWYGGEEIGTAIAETLAGVNNPAGRLPVTFYRDVADLPAFEDYSMRGRTYRYFTGESLYPFGFGLSYSTFAYSGLRVERLGADVRITTRVTNRSTRAGQEVVQVYEGGRGGSSDPIRRLVAFQRINLVAGETRDVTFTLTGDNAPPAGSPVTISVGGGQPIGDTPRVEGVIR